MAKRRMFSLDVVDTDYFLEMPATARLLYYDLGLRADDDGFISPLKVLKLTGATTDDLKVLISKGFAYRFEDGVIVLLHWLRNNKIDASKYTQSIFYARLKPLLKSKLYIEKLSPHRPIQASGAYQKGSPEGPQKGPQKGHQYRLGKGSVGKDKVSNKLLTNITSSKHDEIQEMKDLWKQYAGTTLRSRELENIKAYQYLKAELGEELPRYLQAVRMIRADTYQKRTLQDKLINYVGLREKLENVEGYLQGMTDKHYLKPVIKGI